MKARTLALNTLVCLALLLSACRAPTPTAAPTAALPPATATGAPATATAEPAATEPASPTAAPTGAAPEDVLYLNLMWHQHQPLYYQDEAGVYTRPWVRVHATKDYYDMAAMVADYPNVRVTFNLTPVLLRQLQDFVANGAKDRYWVLAEKPAAALTDGDKDFLLRRFFDANWDHVIGVHPGYQALLDKRGGTGDEAIAAAMARFSEQDFRDLQVWFNLAWIDPDFLAAEPLSALVAKDHGFSEADKEALFGEIRRILAEVIPIHRRLQDAGQIEVTTTPYAHPILPLLYDTNLAAVGNPQAELPEAFAQPDDAREHLARAVAMYTDLFGRPPRGLWPGEGAVAQEIVPLVAEAGFQWMASGEQVLANSIGIGAFTRNAEDTVQQADALYRPYYVAGDAGSAASNQPVLIVFRDLVLSDKVGFTYSGMEGEAAADDFMQRLDNIHARLKAEGREGPYLVSVILDGENAWENYDNDGKAFLHALYQRLSDSTTVKTITPSEFMQRFPEQRKLRRLFPGAWFSPNYDTWIGEPEETQAWNYLRQARADLAEYAAGGSRTPPSAEALAEAFDFMYLAEGSDWFWWYGADQDSGNDSYFDEGFRALLANVYTALGEAVPAYIKVPIVSQSVVAPEQPPAGLITPQVDGRAAAGEWDAAGRYTAAGGVQGRAEAPAEAVYYGVDPRNLYVRVDARADWAALPEATVGVYLASPHLRGTSAVSRLSQAVDTPYLLGFAANLLAEADVASGSATAFTAEASGWAPGQVVTAAVQGRVLELALPLSALGPVDAGDEVRLLVVVSSSGRDVQSLPAGGPGQLILPELGGVTYVLEYTDPQGDDTGPGSYTYPTEELFTPGVFDLKDFKVGYDDDNVVFKISVYGAVPNPWGSPNNLAIQTLDVYVDTDPGAGTGARLLLPGRNAALAAGHGWDYALWAEGWTPAFVAPDPSTLEAKPVTGASFKIIVDVGRSTITLRVPKTAFGSGEPPLERWDYTVAVLSQEGFPAAGVWRVRDGEAAAATWRFGGVPAGATNYPRIFDVPNPSGPQLAFTPSEADVASLGPDDFALVELLQPAQ